MRFARSQSRGFTLIEAMVIIATLGVISAVAVATYRRLNAETPPHNAAKAIVASMERARALAVEHKSDLWMIIYPGFSKRSNTTSAGRGGYFMFEDTKRDFNATTGAAPNVYYRPGVGLEFDPVANAISGPNGSMTDSVFLEEYGGKIRFSLPRAKLEMGEPEAPFAGLPILSSCTFCTPGGRGAIIFSPDKSIHFVDGTGGPIDAAKPQSLTLISDGTKRVSVVVISATDGKLAAFRK